MKFGRVKPAVPRPHFKLRDFLKASLPSAPLTLDMTAPATSILSDIMLNDQLGDCGIAGGYHIVGTETANAGDPFHATTAQITADYSAIGKYIPGDPSTDQGIVLQDALNYWTSHGFANGTKLLGYLAVDPTNVAEVMSALWLFENLYLGLELPDTYTNPFPSSNGFTWGTGTPDPNQGHCIISPAKYDSKTGIAIDSWGLLGTFTFAALAELCSSKDGGECWVMLTPDQMAKGATKAPNGVAWGDIIAAFDSIGGNVPVPSPAPTPPAPAPAPGTSVTLAQATSWAQSKITFPLVTASQAKAAVAAGLAAHWPKS